MTTCFIQDDKIRYKELKHTFKRKTRGRPYGISTEAEMGQSQNIYEIRKNVFKIRQNISNRNFFWNHC